MSSKFTLRFRVTVQLTQLSFICSFFKVRQRHRQSSLVVVSSTRRWKRREKAKINGRVNGRKINKSNKKKKGHGAREGNVIALIVNKTVVQGASASASFIIRLPLLPGRPSRPRIPFVVCSFAKKKKKKKTEGVVFFFLRFPTFVLFFLFFFICPLLHLLSSSHCLKLRVLEIRTTEWWMTPVLATSNQTISFASTSSSIQFSFFIFFLLRQTLRIQPTRWETIAWETTMAISQITLQWYPTYHLRKKLGSSIWIFKNKKKREEKKKKEKGNRNSFVSFLPNSNPICLPKAGGLCLLFKNWVRDKHTDVTTHFFKFFCLLYSPHGNRISKQVKQHSKQIIRLWVLSPISLSLSQKKTRQSPYSLCLGIVNIPLPVALLRLLLPSTPPPLLSQIDCLVT